MRRRRLCEATGTAVLSLAVAFWGCSSTTRGADEPDGGAGSSGTGFGGTGGSGGAGGGGGDSGNDAAGGGPGSGGVVGATGGSGADAESGGVSGLDGGSDSCGMPEVCNGVDDDCDGTIDEEAMCPVAGQVCGAGSCACPDGTFSCAGSCHAQSSCSDGTGSCRRDGVLTCVSGAAVGCSVEAAPQICQSFGSSACDPCGSGGAVAGMQTCDAYGCAYGPCLASPGVVFDDYAPQWGHECGMPHDTSGQNWNCNSNPPNQLGCTCALKTLKLPAGTYRWRVTAGFPPIDTPMTLRAMAGAVQIASETFNIVGLVFNTHQLEFVVTGCTDVTLRIDRSPMKVEYVINQTTLTRI